jgi:hypothetical protein
LPTEGQDLDDPIAFINTDIAAAFQEMCRQTTFDTLSGRATKPYDGGLVKSGDVIPTIAALGPFHWYFRAMGSTVSINRYVDHRAVTRTGSKAPLEVSRATVWRWPFLVGCSQHPTIGRVFDHGDGHS